MLGEQQALYTWDMGANAAVVPPPACAPPINVRQQAMDDTINNDSKEQELLDDVDFQTVWRGYDAAEGQMLEELLHQEGFTARLIGTRSAALIGVGQFTAELRVEVPADRADEARLVLDEFMNASPE